MMMLVKRMVTVCVFLTSSRKSGEPNGAASKASPWAKHLVIVKLIILLLIWQWWWFGCQTMQWWCFARWYFGGWLWWISMMNKKIIKSNRLAGFTSPLLTLETRCFSAVTFVAFWTFWFWRGNIIRNQKTTTVWMTCTLRHYCVDDLYSVL